MLDLVVEGGLVLDGTGSPARPLDVAVSGDTVTSLAEPGTAGSARRRIDATGLVVAPGFVDIHTHLDAQVFWDPFCTPSSLYGVTTVVGGNCGFSIAPLDPHDGGYVQRMLAEVEAIPVRALEQGVPWDWRTFAEYLDAVETARPALNMGFMAGHSAIRRAVLGDGHTDTEPTAAATEQMRTLLREALAAGALGFSSSWNPIHLDGEGDPVPSRYSSAGELLGLCEILADFPGTQVEFIPTVGRFGDDHVELMIAMALAARTTLNWNVLIPEDPDVVHQQLGVSDRAAARGARVMGLTYPGPTGVRLAARSRLFRSVPGWSDVLDRRPDEAAAALRDAQTRDRLRHAATADGAPLAKVVDDLVVTDAHSPETSPSAGSRLGDLAGRAGGDAFDVLFDLWAADGLRTGFAGEPMANSEASWRVRLDTWKDPRVVIGASDAGAHVQVLSTFDYPVVLMALARDLDAMALPDVVRELTDVPARLYGLEGRGRLAEGGKADLVVFDPDRVGPGAPGWRDDLPGGAGRIYSEPVGIEHVVVNGTETVTRNEVTGDRPGRVLRGAAH